MIERYAQIDTFSCTYSYHPTCRFLSIVKGKRLIWNRFKDVILDSDVALLLPWVNRRQPFSGLALELPPTAHELLEAKRDSGLILEIYHDPWTCSLRHISLEAIQHGQHHAQTIGPHFASRYISEWAEPEHISNEPGMHHGSCWRTHIHSKHPLPSEIEDLLEVRFTDAQLRALLHPQELVYWSAEREGWITHTFSISFSPECIREIQESWHLRMLMKEATGAGVEPSVPGTHLQNPDIWRPIISIQPERVVLELRERDSGLVRERRISEKHVALRETSEVKKLLNTEMNKFLKSLTIEPNRRMTAAIENEIAAALEIYGVREDKAPVELESVEIGTDSVGGRVIYVTLLSNDETYRVPVTRHLHSMKEIGRVTRDETASAVESILGDFNLSEESLASAIEECVRLLRKEGLIKR